MTGKSLYYYYYYYYYLLTLWSVIGKAKREIVRVDGREEKGSSRRWNKRGEK